MSDTRFSSATTRVFLALLAGVLAVSVAVTALLVWDRHRANYEQAQHLSGALSRVVSESPTVITALQQQPEVADEPGALQRYAERLRVASGVSFITIMTPEGLRHTHPDTGQIGGRYSGQVPAEPVFFSEEASGPLGVTVRGMTPVLESETGELLGWVAVGVTVDTIRTQLVGELPLVAAITAVFALVGTGLAFVGRAYVRRMAGDLPTAKVREAVSSYESFRVLGQALRAQTHEHGNRMHAAVGLIELGRSDEAVELLTETSTQSQRLVDLLSAPGSIDPTVSALILGKTAQASERGVELCVHIDPECPASSLSPIDLVSALGNLLDNAIDAAATGAREPRMVQVSFGAGATDASLLRVEVTDSGDGFDAESRMRMFEWGYSTKPAGTEGRGVGLALVQRIAEHHGGSLEVRECPTTFVLSVPSGVKS